MAEFSNSNTVSVAAGQNLPLTETSVAGPSCIVHREGAGIVTLRGLTNQCRARFKVSFGSNIAIPTGGTVEAISVALAINGEPLASATAIVTPAAVENYFNVFVAAFIEVPPPEVFFSLSKGRTPPVDFYHKVYFNKARRSFQSGSSFSTSAQKAGLWLGCRKWQYSCTTT